MKGSFGFPYFFYTNQELWERQKGKYMDYIKNYGNYRKKYRDQELREFGNGIFNYLRKYTTS